VAGRLNNFIEMYIYLISFSGHSDPVYCAGKIKFVSESRTSDMGARDFHAGAARFESIP
jgi:hypothetical protein